MMNCVDEGRLRAYLDGELPAMERASIGAHIASCVECQGQLESQRAMAAQARSLLPLPAATPDPHAALARLRSGTQPLDKPRPSGPTIEHRPDQEPAAAATITERRANMQATHFWSGRRPLLATVAAVIAVLSLLALPPVRAAADELLSIFRVQKVVFLPIDPARLQQLANLDFDKNTLFVTKPTVEHPAQPRAVASAAEAASAVGDAVEQPNTFPSTPLTTEFKVSSPTRMQFQINVAAARQVLELMGVDDVTIPDALGASPIVVDVPAFAMTRYHGLNYDLTLHQGRSPNITLPEGLELAQLGKAALRLLGMTPEQAEATSQGIDWNNTLIFPFPKDTSNIRQVTINGENGLLANGGARGQQHWQLYWQRNGKLYMIEASSSMRDDDMVAALIATAESTQ